MPQPQKLLAQLHGLHETIANARRAHHLAKTELANHKNQPPALNPDQSQEILALQNALNNEINEHQALKQTHKVIIAELEAIKQAHQALGEQFEKLQTRADETNANIELLQHELLVEKTKNKDAQKHAALVMAHLKMIDGE